MENSGEGEISCAMEMYEPVDIVTINISIKSEEQIKERSYMILHEDIENGKFRDISLKLLNDVLNDFLKNITRGC